MLRLSIEELSALNLILQFTDLKAILEAASKGFVDSDQASIQEEELSDLCWKVCKTLRN